MTQPIHDILNQLGVVISAQLEAANDRAVSAEADYARLCDGLRKLVGVDARPASVPANDLFNAVAPATAIAKADPVGDAAPRRTTIPDQAFLDALNSTWQGAHAIRKAILASGLKVAYGTVYKRLANLTAAFPDMIEATAEPAGWRLRTPSYVEDADREATEGGRLPCKRPKRGANASLLSTGSMPTNDSQSALTRLIDDDPSAPMLAASSKQATIYNGDSLEVMRKMPSGSVDLIFTSPPYNLGRAANGSSRGTASGKWKGMKLSSGYASYDDARDPAEYVEWQRDVLRECWRLLRDDGAIYYNHKPRVQDGLLQTPLDLNPGLPVRQIVIWDKKCGLNFNQSFYLPTHEWVVIFAKPGFRLRSKAASGLKDVWSLPHERDNYHPAPFPVELAQKAIETTSARVILDPFMGSGSTGVAALACGREFIGIELDHGYCEKAKVRMGLGVEPLAA